MSFCLDLSLAELSDTDFCFMQNVDSPFINKELLSVLYQNRIDTGYVVPTYKDKGGHPILLNRKIIDKIVSIKEYDLNLKDVLSVFERKNVTVEDKGILLNINSKENYLQFFSLEI